MARRNLNYRRIALAVTMTAIVMMAVAPARQLYAQQRSIASEEAKLERLAQENARLEERLARLQDPEYIEKLAREQLGMVRPGEISYVVVPPEASIPEEKPPKPEPEPWYESMWSWLKNLAGAN